ncbi:aminomethyl-transferring glycine dehydrogenase subunit GcvPA [Prevotella disiens]|uniref:aminomethyl-transferring glycine dehydrogenase subunit GcvPA n=1 Tax=Prevotella disiens TaxID=28130 RepID=UPI00336A5336
MNFKFFPHTQEETQEMLNKIGVNSIQDLFAGIPEALRFKGEYDIPEAMSEIEIRNFFNKLANQNKLMTCFAGAGVYDHYAPSAIPQIVSRSEYLTSYTPYQAEISQGTLHYIFEFQSIIAELTNMDVANASLYDGSTATAEAMMVAAAISSKKKTVLYSKTLNPKIIDVLKTYAHFNGVNLVAIEEEEGITSKKDLETKMADGTVAGVIVQQPNYYGITEDFTGFADICHKNKALFIVNSVAADLSLLKTPGEWGADFAVGDVQSLGLPMAFGEPYAGYMSCTQKMMRKMPGRIVGQTKDSRGQRVFVLTLQAREQHIRRQKATSNICSNQSLMALYVTIYSAMMGKQGLKEATKMSFDGAHYLCEKMVATGKAKLAYSQPFFNEFLINIENRDTFYDKAIEKGILPGVKVGKNGLLIAVTEKRTKEEMEALIALL